MADDGDQINFKSALATSLLITSSFAFALGSIYTLAYFQLLNMSILGDISFSFVMLSMFAAFNLTLGMSILDEVYS